METRRRALASASAALLLSVAVWGLSSSEPERPAPSPPTYTEPSVAEGVRETPASLDGQEPERLGVNEASVSSGGVAGEASGGAPHFLAHMLTGDVSRFEPTVETLVTWGLVCGLDPVSVRDVWERDPLVKKHWATVCTARALCDAMSAYDDRQLVRYRARESATPLETELGPRGFELLTSFLGSPTEAAEAVALYSQETQNMLWGAGEGAQEYSTPESAWELLRRIRESEAVTEAADYLSGAILPLENPK